MANPFAKLSIQRDEDEIEVQQAQKAKTPGQPLFGQNDQKAKKKVRPEKKDDKVAHHDDIHDNEGFEVVGKPTKKVYNRNTNNTEEVNKTFGDKPGRKDHNKMHHQKRDEQVFRVNSDKRRFDKQSGTGRGKEIKKGGRGGHYTWEGRGREIVEADETEYHFNKILNNKQEKEKVEEIVEVTPEIKVEEKKEESTEVKAEENVDAKDGDRKFKKKGKKDESNPEEDEKNKLVIPENALTLDEYKKKTQKITTEVSKNTAVKVDLEQITKIDDETICIQGKAKKEGKKKAKNVNDQEAKLNKLVGASLVIEDNSQKAYKKREYKN